MHARGRDIEDDRLALAGLLCRGCVTGLVKGRTKPPGKRPIADAIKLKIIEKTVKERRPMPRIGACA
jgi:hypothetical protein